MPDFERAPDPIDLASDREIIDRDNAIRHILKAANEKPPRDFDGKHCVDCDLEIPKERLAIGRWTCVHCQALKEKRR